MRFYTEQKFNEMIKSTIPANLLCLSFLVLSMRSLIRNFSNLTNLLANIDKRFWYLFLRNMVI